MKKALLTAVALSTATSAAMAQEQQPIGANDFYVGAAIGRTDFEYSGVKKSATPSVKIFGGIHLTDNLAVEVSNNIFSIGSTKLDPNDNGADAELSAYSLGGAAVLMHDINPRTSINVKLGVELYNAEVEFRRESYSQTFLSMFYGVGATYRLTDEIGITASWESHSFEIEDNGLAADLDANTFHVGALFWF